MIFEKFDPLKWILLGGHKMKKVKLQLKRELHKITQYTDEERYQLFAEGKIKVPTMTKNKKKYIRKEKHKIKPY